MDVWSFENGREVSFDGYVYIFWFDGVIGVYGMLVIVILEVGCGIFDVIVLSMWVMI